jgi:WD40 repeat protein
VLLAGCDLLPGGGPTPFPVLTEPTPTPTTAPAELPTAVPQPGLISIDNVSQLNAIGTVPQDLAGELAWSPNGETLAMTTIHGSGIYDVHSLLKLRPLESDVTPTSLAFSPGGARVVTGGRDIPESPQDTITIWRANDGTKLQTLIGHTEWVNSVAYSPTNELIASGSDDSTIRLWRVEGGTEARVLEGHSGPVSSVTFSPDGELVASGSLDGKVRLWRASDGTLIVSLEDHELGVTSVDFSPDGITLASASADGTIQLWAAGTGTPLHTLTGHTGTVSRVDFSPDGALLVSAGWDNTIRFWSVRDGTLLHAIDAHADSVLSVGFSPDGIFVASASLDGSMSLWGLGPRAEVTPVPTSVPVEDPVPHLAAGTALILTEIHMLSDTEGWAIGDDEGRAGHIFRTEDGGATWIDVTPPQSREPAVGFERIVTGDFYDPYTGWVVYHPPDFVGGPSTLDALQVWRTSDGGVTWQGSVPQAPLDINEGPPMVVGADSQNVWILTEFFVGVGQHGSTLVRSTDSGTSWDVLQLPPDSMSSCHRTGLAFANGTTGWMTNECPFELAGGVFVDVTSDGGATWERIELEPPPGQPEFEGAYSICKTHSPNLHSATEGGLIVECTRSERAKVSYLYRTEDGGANWSASSYPGGILHYVDRNTAWAFSREIYKSVDGGESWTLVKTVSWEGDFSFVDGDTGWAIARTEGAVALVRTTNGAGSWSILEPVVGP